MIQFEWAYSEKNGSKKDRLFKPAFIAKCRFFYKYDLKRTYFQICLTPLTAHCNIVHEHMLIYFKWSGDTMYDVVVIGAGQAGLAMGFYLKQTNYSFLLLDKAKKIGETWRNRYDSLTLFTPRAYNELPDLQLNGSRHGYPTKDEIADYLTSYASHHSIPIQLDTVITRVTKVNDIK